MIDVYYLKDTNTGYITGKFEVDKSDDRAVFGKCYSAVGWIKPDIPVDFHLLADVYCKSDSCTHWNFYGEDSVDGNIEDGYYHLCGPMGFNDHIRLMCFVWKLVADIMGEKAIHNYFESLITNELVRLMLAGYEIVKEEG